MRHNCADKYQGNPSRILGGEWLCLGRLANSSCIMLMLMHPSKLPNGQPTLSWPASAMAACQLAYRHQPGYEPCKGKNRKKEDERNCQNGTSSECKLVSASRATSSWSLPWVERSAREVSRPRPRPRRANAPQASRFTGMRATRVAVYKGRTSTPVRYLFHSSTSDVAVCRAFFSVGGFPSSRLSPLLSSTIQSISHYYACHR